MLTAFLQIASMPGDFEVNFYSVIRRYHIYNAIWTLSPEASIRVAKRIKASIMNLTTRLALIISATFKNSDRQMALCLEPKKKAVEGAKWH